MAVSRLPLTAEAPVRSQVSPSEIRAAQSGSAETGFYASTSGFRLSVLFHQRSVLIFIYMLLLP
jgi:hypothetical protein